jgi:hypothetical protein
LGDPEYVRALEEADELAGALEAGTAALESERNGKEGTTSEEPEV